MQRHRTPYAAEFRAQMVELVRAGRTPEELTKEHKSTAKTIYNWVAQTDHDAGKRHDGLTTHTQKVAAAKAGISVCGTRRVEAAPTPPSQKPQRSWRTRADPLADVWDTEIRPLLEREPRLMGIIYAPSPGRVPRSLPGFHVAHFAAPHPGLACGQWAAIIEARCSSPSSM